MDFLFALLSSGQIIFGVVVRLLDGMVDDAIGIEWLDTTSKGGGESWCVSWTWQGGGWAWTGLSLASLDSVGWLIKYLQSCHSWIMY